MGIHGTGKSMENGSHVHISPAQPGETNEDSPIKIGTTTAIQIPCGEIGMFHNIPFIARILNSCCQLRWERCIYDLIWQ